MPDPTVVQRMFGKIAGRYDLTNDVLSLGIHRRWRRRLVRRAAVAPGMRALDVCCGTGDLSFALRAAGADVVGADFCAPMVAEAARKATHRAPVPFLVGDALCLPFAAASFDLVTVAFGIRNVADPRAGLAEMARVARPGGAVVVLEFCHPRVPLVGAAYRFYFRDVLPRLGALVSGDRDGAYRYLQRSVDAFPEREAFLDVMRDAGLVEPRFELVSCGIAAIYSGRVVA